MNRAMRRKLKSKKRGRVIFNGKRLKYRTKE
jgi:hypothetical protein